MNETRLDKMKGDMKEFEDYLANKRTEKLKKDIQWYTQDKAYPYRHPQYFRDWNQGPNQQQYYQDLNYDPNQQQRFRNKRRRVINFSDTFSSDSEGDQINEIEGAQYDHIPIRGKQMNQQYPTGSSPFLPRGPSRGRNKHWGYGRGEVSTMAPQHQQEHYPPQQQPYMKTRNQQYWRT